SRGTTLVDRASAVHLVTNSLFRLSDWANQTIGFPANAGVAFQTTGSKKIRAFPWTAREGTSANYHRAGVPVRAPCLPVGF
ncbi:MAG: hypothetical protein KAI94_01710, partial [Anaerolineales bacterium]|nr:hypothetical protein [Anaerolineales bacterium]